MGSYRKPRVFRPEELYDPDETAFMDHANCLGVDPDCKRCGSCGETKPLSEYYRDRDKRDGLATTCKTCKKASSLRAYWNNPEAYRRRRRIGRLQISNLQLHAMEVRQDRRCAICGSKPESELHIDHDHGSGAIRELLCGGCNIGLGAFGDDPERLRAAASYLDRHRAEVGDAV